MDNWKKAFGLVLLGLLALVACQTPAPMPTPTPEPQSGIISEELVSRITPEEVKALLEAGQEIVIVDTRSREEYEQQHIINAISLPFDEIGVRHGELPRDKKLVLYCT